MVKQKYSEKITELENNYKRALADYQNQERRHKEMESSLIKNASAPILEKLLVILDSLEMAQLHLKDQGLQMVIDQSHKLLQSEGLEPIETDGKPFDPFTMDCTELVDGPKDIVIETVSKGYTLFGKALRPARVKVGTTIAPNTAN